MIDEKKLIETIVNTPSNVKRYLPEFLDGMATRQNEIIDIIQRQPKTDWIPCEERLPHTEMPVWTTHENGQVIEHYWYRGKFVNNYPLEPRPYPKVIAWMPKEIPQPYKKEGAE